MDRDVGVRMFCFGLQAVLVRDNMWMGGKNRLVEGPYMEDCFICRAVVTGIL